MQKSPNTPNLREAILIAGTLLVALALSRDVLAEDWKMGSISIPTRWAKEVNPDHPWPEYPRPTMVRPDWTNLNGLWEYAITDLGATLPVRFDGRILTPYPIESALSGVERTLEPNQALWYHRTFDAPAIAQDDRTLLHFGAVDFEATVWVNGRKIGVHRGGYQSFTMDITGALKRGINALDVRVWDPTDAGPNPHGKQSLYAKWACYTPSSGIWQTVWLEQVPTTYIDALKVSPDVEHGQIRVEIERRGEATGIAVEATVLSDGKPVARGHGMGPLIIAIPSPRLWSPDDPYLYDLDIRLERGGKEIDHVVSYFGMRTVKVERDGEGRPRIYLNGKFLFNLGVADQGFWPDGLYTAPTDAALKFDLQAAKAMGFNTIRKHIKIEPERWYYYADRLGLMVWQDMPSGNNDSTEARAEFEAEVRANVVQLSSHPSVTTWILFNEGWGMFDQARLASALKRTDPSRLVDGLSGPMDQIKIHQWEERLDPREFDSPFHIQSDVLDEFQDLQLSQKWSPIDIVDLHWYPGPRLPSRHDDAALVNGENGSWGVFVENHVLDDLRPTGIGIGATSATPAAFLKAYASWIGALRELTRQGMSGAAYFDLTDVEGEQEGLLTYDRELSKVPVADLARLNGELVPRAHDLATAVVDLSVGTADQTPESDRYAELLAAYRAGRRDVPFLQRLALMAARQPDYATATAASDLWIAASVGSKPKDFWPFVAATTFSVKSQGYSLLAAQTQAADAVLGAQAAELRQLAAIRTDIIEPVIKAKPLDIDWAALTRLVEAQGTLGAEAVLGVQMMSALIRKDWTGFGTAYSRYYSTATSRSAYPVTAMSYQVLRHVDDRQTLEAAIKVMRWQIEQPSELKFGRYDSVELDCLASLLFKAGHRAEALHWESKASDLARGSNAEIIAHQRHMSTAPPLGVNMQVDFPTFHGRFSALNRQPQRLPD